MVLFESCYIEYYYYKIDYQVPLCFVYRISICCVLLCVIVVEYGAF